VHDVPDIDQSEADASRDRRRDSGVGEIQPGAVDLTLIGSERARGLIGRRSLRVELLPGQNPLCDEILVAIEVELRVLQRGLIFGGLPFRLGELHLERPRIELGEQVTFVDDLTFRERHLGELSIDAASHRHRIQRRGRANAGQVDAHVAAPRRRRDDGDAAGAIGLGLTRRLRLTLRRARNERIDGADDDATHDRPRPPTADSGRASRRHGVRRRRSAKARVVDRAASGNEVVKPCLVVCQPTRAGATAERRVIVYADRHRQQARRPRQRVRKVVVRIS